MNLYITILFIFAAGLGGGLLSFLIPHEKQKLISYLLIATGAYLFSIMIRHIIPHSVEHYGELTLVWVLAGFFLQHIIQQFSQGVEHGHTHVHEHLPLQKLIYIIIGLGIHAFFEAAPLVESFQNTNLFSGLLVGLILHKVPECFALACLVSHTVSTKFKRLIWITGFSIITPIALLFFSMYKNSEMFSPQIFGAAIGLICGTLLHISTTIIFETTNNKHQIKWYKIICLVVGFGVSLIL
ncbi:MAG: hypothetical protein RJA07_2132 [Bacteroidota bacterium]